MILAVDVGNSITNLGFYDEKNLIADFKLKSDSNRTIDQLCSDLSNLLKPYDNKFSFISGAIISSVVPILEKKWVNLIKKLYNVSPLTLGPKLKTGIAIKVDNPKEVGADLIADCLGAKEKYKLPAIIADLGTANKIIAVGKDGSFLGCSIGPGLEIGKEAMVKRTAALPEVDFSIPPCPIGKNTIDSMNSALTYGNAMFTKGMCELFSSYFEEKPTLILTGGCSVFVKPLLPEFIYDSKLLLDGLVSLYLRRKK